MPSLKDLQDALDAIKGQVALIEKEMKAMQEQGADEVENVSKGNQCFDSMWPLTRVRRPGQDVSDYLAGEINEGLS